VVDPGCRSHLAASAVFISTVHITVDMDILHSARGSAVALMQPCEAVFCSMRMHINIVRKYIRNICTYIL